MNQLLILVFVAHSIRNQAAGIDEKITAVLVQHEIHSDLIGTLSVQLLEARNIIKSIPRGEEYSSAYFQQAKRELKNKLRVNDFGAELEKIRSLSQLFRELDIAVPVVGFIDQNQVQRHLLPVGPWWVSLLTFPRDRFGRASNESMENIRTSTIKCQFRSLARWMSFPVWRSDKPTAPIERSLNVPST